MLLITPFYAGILGFLLIALSWRIVKLRHNHQNKMQEVDHTVMAAATRAQGNLIEYLPTALLLMFFVEILEFRALFVHALGITLVVARLMHVKGINDPSGKSTLRKLGTRLTWGMMGVAATLSMIGAFGISF